MKTIYQDSTVLCEAASGVTAQAKPQEDSNRKLSPIEFQSKRKSEFAESPSQKDNDGKSSEIIDAALSKAYGLTPGNLTREVILHLWDGEHTSHRNPAELDDIANCMQEKGFMQFPPEKIAWAVRHIQKKVIVPSRKEKHFIGTSGKGVYLIESREDAKKTLKWYKKRMASQAGHVKNLKHLMKALGK